MRHAEDRLRPDPEHKLLSVFPETEVADILDAFGDPEGEFAEEPGSSPSRGGQATGVNAPANDGPFPDVPDADAVAPGSPADPASPTDGFHGTDLLNGAGRTEAETRQDR